MRKLILISGILFALAIVVDSCSPRRGIPRPQGHPTPPGKFSKITKPAVDQQTTVFYS